MSPLCRFQCAEFIATFLLLLYAISPCCAAIYMEYPGLGELVAESEAVVVAEILKSLEPPNVIIEGYEDCAVRVRSVLKGPLSSGCTMTLSLRFLSPHPLAPPEEIKELSKAAFDIPYQAEINSGPFVIFLHKTNSIPGRSPTWHSLNYAGAVLRVNGKAEMKKRSDETVLQCLRRLVGAPTPALNQPLQHNMHTVPGAFP